MPTRPRPRHRPLTPATLAGVLSLIFPTVTLARLYTIHPMLKSSLLPVAYTCFISGVTFLTYGYDKMQARNLEWRVSELTLHFLGLLGGWPGALVGMHFFQHKTRKTSFLILFWGIVLGWQGMLWTFLYGDQSKVTW
ncbi:DUF1294-domain-containing protein [Macroventuria anomochaeta]|uniref:DUF1294-domain-containing protein n=1 Tax=Macroventuria anomochaeta TaxID=301207 RepID=A0ACB6RP17_9PLEO|nr:DUF1294-domain-containing protein [Macroventuria anomochaeta]KAF2622687.1 DUF1294-domain-containing protein [Macroventuria anomochaeta]